MRWNLPLQFIFTVGALTLLSSGSAIAESKPRPSTPADPQAVMSNYLGQTWDWSRGGSYWGSGGAFEAVWTSEDGTPAYGEGKWYVTTKGTLCYEATWRWPGEDAGSEDLKRCWRHVTDKNGQIWQRSHEKEEWYRLDPEKTTSGNKIRSEVSRIKAAIAG